jgi:hypothetical protein
MKSILELIPETPTNADLRIVAQALEKQIAELQQKCARLESELGSVKQQPAPQRKATEFVEHRGAFFKRRPNGGYDDDVLCRGYRQPMVSFANIHPFSCEPCGITINFAGSDLPRIMMELKQL